MEGTAKQNLDPVLLGREGKNGRLASPSRLTPQGTFLPLQKVGTEGRQAWRKDRGKTLVTEEAIFSICYSYVPFSDRLVRNNWTGWKQSKLSKGGSGELCGSDRGEKESVVQERDKQGEIPEIPGRLRSNSRIPLW